MRRWTHPLTPNPCPSGDSPQRGLVSGIRRAWEMPAGRHRVLGGADALGPAARSSWGLGKWSPQQRPTCWAGRHSPLPLASGSLAPQSSLLVGRVAWVAVGQLSHGGGSLCSRPGLCQSLRERPGALTSQPTSSRHSACLPGARALAAQCQAWQEGLGTAHSHSVKTLLH